jgi:hypothetical protein
MRYRGGVRSTRVVLAVVVIAAAIVAIAAPVEVGRALGRTASSSSEMINLRASWGGALLGIGAAIGWARTETRGRLVVSLLMWLMVGIGLARAVGFVLDGSPDRLQWLWLAAEIVIASVCAWWLRRPAAR